MQRRWTFYYKRGQPVCNLRAKPGANEPSFKEQSFSLFNRLLNSLYSLQTQHLPQPWPAALHRFPVKTQFVIQPCQSWDEDHYSQRSICDRHLGCILKGRLSESTECVESRLRGILVYMMKWQYSTGVAKSEDHFSSLPLIFPNFHNGLYQKSRSCLCAESVAR